MASFASKAGERFVYDDLGRLIEVADEAGNQTTYTYDAVGNILSVQTSTSPVQPPTISSITPAAGTLGSAVALSITGTNLTGASLSTDNPGIAISGVRSTASSVNATFTISNDARLGVTIVTLTALGGTTTANFNIAARSPVLTSLDPTSGPATRIVTINGDGFASDPSKNQVSFNSTSAAILSVTTNRITTQVPTGATSGNVVVTTNGLPSNPLLFTVVAAGPPPTASGISPNIGSVEGGVLIAISGSGFVAGTTVKIGGKPLSSLTVQDANTITGIVPSAASTGAVDVIVSNANGDAFLPGAFTYLAGGRHEVTQVDPAPGAFAPTNTRITLQFTRPVDRATVNAASVAVTDGVASVNGSLVFSLSDTVITFIPSTNLAPNKSHTFTVSQAVKSIDGVPLSRPYTGFVTTTASADTTSPTVKLVPLNGATGIPYNTNITVEFSEPANPISLNAQSLSVSDSTGVKNGSIVFSADRRVATFTPFAPFFPTSQVSITLTSQVTDSAGNAIVGSAGGGSNLVSSFTTATNADILPPRVISVNPPVNASGININTNVTLTFSEPVDTTTITSDSFQVLINGVPISGNISFGSGNTIATL